MLMTTTAGQSPVSPSAGSRRGESRVSLGANAGSLLSSNKGASADKRQSLWVQAALDLCALLMACRAYPCCLQNIYLKPGEWEASEWLGRRKETRRQFGKCWVDSSSNPLALLPISSVT